MKKRKMEKGIVREKMLKYMSEAIQAMKDRGLWFEVEMSKSLNVAHVNPEVVLDKFSRSMAADLSKKDKDEARKVQKAK